MTRSFPPSILRIESLFKRYAPQRPWVVQDLSLTVAPGQILSLVGPSGCGKTTTLRLIAGFEHADAGVITLGDQTLSQAGSERGGRAVHRPPHQRGVGVVFQDYALFPHLSVLDNVLYGIRLPDASARQRHAMNQLDMLGLADLAHRMPHTLSGGQQQRVALARTIAAAPGVVLLDEPFSNLDVTLRQAARRDVRQTLINQGVPAILVTHDREEAMIIGDRVAVMHEGRIAQAGSAAELYHQPANRFVAAFLGSLIELDAVAAGQTATCALGAIPLVCAAQGRVRIALRPEQIVPQPLPETTQASDASPVGTVAAIEFCGHCQTLFVELAGHTLPVAVDGMPRFSTGQRISLTVRGSAHIFNA